MGRQAEIVKQCDAGKMLSVQGRTALIIGGGRAIGLAIAAAVLAGRSP